MNNSALIDNFYRAFQRKDYQTMQNLYATNATFSDPVFVNLNSEQVRCMWEMLLTASTDLSITFKNVQDNPVGATCDWEAVYTFTLTGKKVHNIIHAQFVIENGKIVSHRDQFDLYRWSRMAFGFKGLLLGWTSFMQNQIRTKAGNRLTSFMKKRTVKAD
jgi:limonene-1,2-epoxide hydrolase